MSRGGSLILALLLAFGAAMGGTMIGRTLFTPPRPVESELHDLLHDQLRLDAAQTRLIDAQEAAFKAQQSRLEDAQRAANARLAAAIQAEHGYGPQVAAAVDASHQAMGDLQKASLEHVFAMRGVLHPDQAARFDAAIVEALTAKKP